jgi:hypothetical protein
MTEKRHKVKFKECTVDLTTRRTHPRLSPPPPTNHVRTPHSRVIGIVVAKVKATHESYKSTIHTPVYRAGKLLIEQGNVSQSVARLLSACV